MRLTLEVGIWLQFYQAISVLLRDLHETHMHIQSAYFNSACSPFRWLRCHFGWDRVGHLWLKKQINLMPMNIFFVSDLHPVDIIAGENNGREMLKVHHMYHITVMHGTQIIRA